jgi:hypothetical protein
MYYRLANLWTANILRLEGKRINLALVYIPYSISYKDGLLIPPIARSEVADMQVECNQKHKEFFPMHCHVSFTGSGNTSLAEWGRVKVGEVYQTAKGEVK